MTDNNVDNKIREQAQKDLESLISSRYKIFIDTCSLMEPSARKFWENVVPLLDIYNAKIIVPKRCCDELEKHRNSNDSIKRKSSEDAIKILNQLNNAGYIDVRGEETDNFSDNVFQVVFTKFRMSYKLCLITQDRDLTEDILKLNDSKAVKSENDIIVRKINKYGFLSKIYPKNSKPTNKVSPPKAPTERVDENEQFLFVNEITRVEDNPMGVTEIPGLHGKAFFIKDNEIHEVTLISEIGSGGEARVYATDIGLVAKIYKKENITRRKYEKIKLMLSKKFSCEGICYPVAALFNKEKEFVGYLMPPAKGIELQRGVFIKPVFLKKFPGWRKADTVNLCITILKKIKYLHDRNILMCDINPANILVVSPEEVYFVDTDSYQIEGYPCPVGMTTFTAPEIQGKRFGDFLRTFGNENFAVATLLFMIMLPGKTPYAQQGGEDQSTNIIEMDFSYPFGDNSNKKTPDGPWRYIWSHLTYNIKEAFYTTFRKGEIHSTEETRLSVDEWLSLFEYYHKLLVTGKYRKQDEMSEELFPTRYKKSEYVTFVKCALCGMEKPENNCRNGYCNECLAKGESYRCDRCNKLITYTNYDKYIKHGKKYRVCKECYEWENEIGYSYRCADCYTMFYLTNKECEYYRDRRLDMPKRCKDCRERRKRIRTSSYSSYSSSSTSSSSSSSSSLLNDFGPYRSGQGTDPGLGSFCFITTAVCEYYGKDDDCYEMNILRNYRDDWLIKQPDGLALITEYYNTAPLIVAKMKQSRAYPDYCQRLMNEYISPCVRLIEEKKYEECKRLYSKMFYYMKDELL